MPLADAPSAGVRITVWLPGSPAAATTDATALSYSRARPRSCWSSRFQPARAAIATTAAIRNAQSSGDVRPRRAARSDAPGNGMGAAAGGAAAVDTLDVAAL